MLCAGFLLLLLLPRNSGAYRALPTQSAIVLEFNGLLKANVIVDSLSDESWKSAWQTPMARRCFQDGEIMIKLLGKKAMRSFLHKKLLAAFTLNEADSLNALYALELDFDPDLPATLKNNAQAPRFFQHQFHGHDLYTLYFSKTSQIELAYSGGLLLYSRKATLVEDALAQLDQADNWWSRRPLISSLPDAPIKAYWRPSALAEQWRGKMAPGQQDLPELIARNVTWVGAAWDGARLSVLTETSGFLGGMKNWGKAPKNDALSRVLPDNTAFIARAGLGNIPDFFKGISGERGGDFEHYCLPWVGEEAALVVTDPVSPALSADRLLVLAVRDSAKAVQSLQSFEKERGTQPGANRPYQMFEVYSFSTASLLRPLFGDDAAFRNPVCALVEGYAVFAPDRSSLEIFLDKYLVNQTLAGNTDFLQLQQKRSANSPVGFYLNTALLKNLLNKLGPELPDAGFVTPGMCSIDLQPGWWGKTRVELHRQGLAQAPVSAAVLWKTVLPEPLATAPFRDNSNPKNPTVLCQDQGNTLYCIDARDGRVRWSRSLPGRLLSEVKTIDFYGGGETCYTFNTAQHLYILDENGKDVNGFPLKLPAEAQNAATVVDFDHNAKFYFFVACRNGKIYGFGHLGKPLDGWNGIEAEGLVGTPLLHFQHKGKDYLCTLSDEGLLRVCGRDGATRFPPLRLDGHFTQPLQVDTGATAPRIYAASDEGALYACDLNGEVSAIQAGKGKCHTAFGQLNGDERFEWALAEGNQLSAGHDQKVLFKKTLSGAVQQVFFAPGNRIGAVDQKSRRIWLINAQGQSPEGFPLGGNTLFSLGDLNGVETLVVGNWNAVWAYRVR